MTPKNCNFLQLFTPQMGNSLGPLLVLLRNKKQLLIVKCRIFLCDSSKSDSSKTITSEGLPRTINLRLYNLFMKIVPFLFNINLRQQIAPQYKICFQPIRYARHTIEIASTDPKNQEFLERFGDKTISYQLRVVAGNKNQFKKKTKLPDFYTISKVSLMSLGCS